MPGRVHPFYSALIPLGLAAALPVWLIRSLWRPDLRAHLPERFGLLPEATRARLAALPVRPLWTHAASVGETMVARRLVAALRGAGYRAPHVISSTTAAGRSLAASQESGAAAIFYLPIDWTPCIGRTLRQVNPEALLCVETEIWPALIAECNRGGIPVLIASGRISERSRRRYARFAPFFAPAFSCISLACMQTEADADRAVSLGLPADRVAVTGNVKFDTEPPSPSAELMALLDVRPGGAGQVVVAGSTSPGEEAILIDTIEALRHLNHGNLTLILAPRHRERFDDVAALLDRRGVVWRRRSAMTPWPAVPDRPGPRVILLDSIGELASVYGLADVAFVGGSLVPRGGQNLLEPAALGVPVVFGPRVENFQSVAEALVAAGAGFQVRDTRELAQRLGQLLSDPGSRSAAGKAGRSLVESHRGATRRTIERLIPALGTA